MIGAGLGPLTLGENTSPTCISSMNTAAASEPGQQDDVATASATDEDTFAEGAQTVSMAPPASAVPFLSLYRPRPKEAIEDDPQNWHMPALRVIDHMTRHLPYFGGINFSDQIALAKTFLAELRIPENALMAIEYGGLSAMGKAHLRSLMDSYFRAINVTKSDLTMAIAQDLMARHSDIVRQLTFVGFERLVCLLSEKISERLDAHPEGRRYENWVVETLRSKTVSSPEMQASLRAFVDQHISSWMNNEPGGIQRNLGCSKSRRFLGVSELMTRLYPVENGKEMQARKLSWHQQP